MPQSQAFLEVLSHFHESIDLVDALRKSSEAVEGFILSVHIIDHVVDRLNYAFKVSLCLLDCIFLRSIRHISIRLILHGHPHVVRRLNALVYKVFDRRISGAT